MSTVRRAYTDRMINTAPGDAAARERFYLCIHALADVENALTMFIQSGDIEKIQAVKKEKAHNAGDKRKRTS